MYTQPEKEHICCFSGHRVVLNAEREAAITLAKAKILSLYSAGTRIYRTGGALGWDTMMANLLFHLRDSGLSGLRVVLVYPYDGFTRAWPELEQIRYDERLHLYDDVVRVSEKTFRGVYHARNRALVDGSDFCIAYQTKDSGGTAYTTKYARARGVEVFNIAEEVRAI